MRTNGICVRVDGLTLKHHKLGILNVEIFDFTNEQIRCMALIPRDTSNDIIKNELDNYRMEYHTFDFSEVEFNLEVKK